MGGAPAHPLSSLNLCAFCVAVLYPNLLSGSDKREGMVWWLSNTGLLRRTRSIESSEACRMVSD
jgi:hypothetical protein